MCMFLSCHLVGVEATSGGASDGSNDSIAVAVGGLDELGALPSSPQLLSLRLPAESNEACSIAFGGVGIVGNGRAEAVSMPLMTGGAVSERMPVGDESGIGSEGTGEGAGNGKPSSRSPERGVRLRSGC